ncbi:hypothetical protein PoB_001400800 [Plakobranchus ocellatus]|uniref:Uncharacterized protein n=1 Tax=Plakobranchus ocellatus TaxID=259542 RepID=A0AAV3YZ40_9GAST|nr:hypothetical protein PoB_001400800 [Plakobranchus ocellatus]
MLDLSHQNTRSHFTRDVAGGLAGGHLRKKSQISTPESSNSLCKMTPAQEQAEQGMSAKCVTPKKQTSGSSASNPTYCKSKPPTPKSKAAMSQKE